MFMGTDIPIAASASGGVYNYKDGRTAPDTINVLLEYPAAVHRDVRSHAGPRHHGRGDRILRHRRAGCASTAARYEFTPVGARRAAHGGEGDRRNLDLDHVQNFLECVKSRKLPNGDVLIGHRSAQASHLGNISYMQKRRIDFDPVREEILPF